MSTEKLPVGADLPGWPDIDFSEIGAFEEKFLTRIQGVDRLIASSWLVVHSLCNVLGFVGHYRLEQHRKTLAAEKPEVKVMALAFQVNALVAVLKAFSQFMLPWMRRVKS